jgi:hypothetical protein
VFVIPLESVCIHRGRRGIENKVDRSAFNALLECGLVVDEIPVLKSTIEKRSSFFQVCRLSGRELSQIENSMPGPASTTVQVLSHLPVTVADSMRMSCAD